MHKLIPSVFLSVFVMGLIDLFSQIANVHILGKLFEPVTTLNLTYALNISQILGQSFFYCVLLFSVDSFLFHLSLLRSV